MSFFKKFNNLDTKRGFVSSRANRFLKLGQDIDGEAADDSSGYSVSMNAAGDRVAIGTYNNDVGGARTNAGHVRVYSWNGTAWTQLGVDIDGEAASNYSGYSVSMNAAGDRVAIGAIYNDVDGAGKIAGHVRVYSWNGTAWTQLGVDIDGEALGDLSGYSVSMNAAGDRVAIGATYNDGGGSNSGHVRVYSWNGADWTQLGVDINGEAAGDLSGSSVSMNAAGDRVAIGAYFNNVNGARWIAGHVRVYSWNGTAWTQLGVDIDGEAAGDLSGSPVSMNAAGDRVAIGARNNDGNGSNAGHVRVYKDYQYYDKLDIWKPKFDALFYDIAISSNGGLIWVVASDIANRTQWTSTDYGNTWSSYSDLGSSRFPKLAMSSNGVIRAHTSENNQIYVSTNSGVNWTARDSNRSWYGIAMSSNGVIQAAVVLGGQIYVSTNTGTNWTARESNRYWYGIAMSSNGVIQAAVASEGQIYVSTNSGTNWTARDSNRNWRSIAMSSDGTKQTAVVHNGQIYVSTNSGSTWTAKESVRDWSDIAMSSDGVFQTAITSSFGKIYVSTDSGSTWTEKESTRSWRSVAMSSNGLIQVATTNDYIYVSS